MQHGIRKQVIFGIAAALTAVFCLWAASFPVYAEEEMGALFSIHTAEKGWHKNSSDNTYCRAWADSYGTAIRATLQNQPKGMTGTISYQVNLNGYGWLDWSEDSLTAGTTESIPIEAVRVKLTGELADNYDVYYCILQDGIWTDLVMNGETAGIEGHGKRVYGIRIAIRKKNAGAPEEPEGGTFDPGGSMVALTFDDGPSVSTPRILNSLEANGGKATFFMVGNRIGSYQTSVRRMRALGCETASHTWNHTYITKLTPDELKRNLEMVNWSLRSVAGTSAVIMRPPGGFINDESKAVLAELGIPAVLWSIDTQDWKTRDTQATVSSVLTDIKDGDIVLMHDLYEATAAAAETIIPELIRRGYQLVTVSELAAARGGMQPGQAYREFRQ